jgi:hypothetical protein
LDELQAEFIAKNRHLHALTRDIILAAKPRIDRGTQFLMSEAYAQKARAGVVLPFCEVEYSNYSQNGEDGVLHYIFSLIGATNRVVIEMSAGNCMECNATNLIINHNWRGLLFDGNQKKIDAGLRFFRRHFSLFEMPAVTCAWITKDNINDLISSHGCGGDIDLFSLDVDGVDYWLLDALNVVSPRVIILEAQFSFGPDRAVTVPYADDFQSKRIYDGDTAVSRYEGASVNAFVKLNAERGYRLVGMVGHRGPNLVFMRNDVGAEFFPKIEPTDLFRNMPAYLSDQFERSRPIVDSYQWVEVRQ